MMLQQLAFAFAWPTTAIGWIYECVGILASLFVFVSFFWSNEKLTRIINMVGCTVFVVYAVLIGSLSVCIMNGACLVLHVVKLTKMYIEKRKQKRQNNDEVSAEQNAEGSEPRQEEKTESKTDE